MKTIIIYAIKFYQRLLAPLFAPACRFYPTCSDYAIESVEKKGAIKGCFYAIMRILKCNPLHPGGFDPVKE